MPAVFLGVLQGLATLQRVPEQAQKQWDFQIDDEHDWVPTKIDTLHTNLVDAIRTSTNAVKVVEERQILSLYNQDSYAAHESSRRQEGKHKGSGVRRTTAKSAVLYPRLLRSDATFHMVPG